ncbi:MAG TPA: GNAT family N-acetyltransferase [Chloroflexota bacterium]|nr:GNAT family N-acetyltransferase [Chloroflexota bacterium]
MEIKPLTAEHIPHIPAVISGYQTGEIYQVTYTEGEMETAVTLRLVALPQTLNKRFPPLDEHDLARYQLMPAQGFSFGLFNLDVLVGIALAEPMHWNNSLWVWEFHIAGGYRGEGWGRLLMTRVIAQAQTAGLRTIVCETQNTNVPAIRFYRRMGFRVEGIDISYYSNNDLNPDREVAVFMKRRLEIAD